MRLTCTQLCIYSPHRWAFHHLGNQSLRSSHGWSRHETCLHPALHIFSSQMGFSSSKLSESTQQSWLEQTWGLPASSFAYILLIDGLIIIYAICVYAALRVWADMRLTCTHLCIYSPHMWVYHHLSIHGWSRHETYLHPVLYIFSSQMGLSSSRQSASTQHSGLE